MSTREHRRTWRVVALVGVLFVLFVLRGSAAGSSVTLRVRILNLAALDDGQIIRALATTGGLYEAVGIDLDWLPCDLSDGPVAGSACNEPMAPGETWVRVLPDSPVRRPDVAATALGFATVDTSLGRGVIANVYSGRIARFASVGGTEFETWLGRVIAHELGHLVLGSTTHTRGGLMRAGWSAIEPSTGTTEAWDFSTHDGSRLRTRLAEGLATSR